MEYKKLGQTNLNISRIGFGCWAIGGHGYGPVDDEQSIAAVQKALEVGINFFDTADVYGFGHSEEILSKALGSSRKKVIIATKFGMRWDDSGRVTKDSSPRQLERALEASLKRLQLDSIPLYQIHWYDGLTPFSEIFEAMEKWKKQGKIQQAGCCNFGVELLAQSAPWGRFESLQCEVNVDKPLDPDVAKFASEKKMSVLAWGVLLRGLFSGKYSHTAQFGKNDTRSKDKDFQGEEREKHEKTVIMLRQLSAKTGLSPAQLAISLILKDQTVSCAIVGAKTPEQVVLNAAALSARPV